MEPCRYCGGTGIVDGGCAKEIARMEFAIEQRRDKVERIKDELRKKKPLFPWRIKIERV